MRKIKKPHGNSTTITINSNGPSFQENQLPNEKSAIEQHFAEIFCTDNHGVRPHFKKFGRFENLTAQAENSIDFKVETSQGTKWLELTEFAPIKEVGGYEQATGEWDGSVMASLFINLVKRKNNKHYGSDVILIVYATHDRFWVPPPIIRLMPTMLKNENICFEAIYMMSPTGLTKQAWPEDPDDQGPRGLGQITVGPFSGT